MASLLKTAHVFPKDTDFSSTIPTSASRVHVQNIQVGKGKPMGVGEFFPLEVVTEDNCSPKDRLPGQHKLRFWLNEVTYNSRIYAPYGGTSFMVQEEDVINDLRMVEQAVHSMNFFPGFEFHSYLRTIPSIIRGRSNHTFVRTKVTDKTGIFEDGVKGGTLEKLQSATDRRASAILVLNGIYRNDERNSYHITTRLEQISWSHKFSKDKRKWNGDMESPAKAPKQKKKVKSTVEASKQKEKVRSSVEAPKQKVSSSKQEKKSVKQTSEEPPAKCRKVDKQAELDKLKGSFMKHYFEKQMDDLLLVATDFPTEDSCDYIFLSSLIETVLSIEAQIQSSEDLSMVLSHLTETHDSMVKSYNQTYMAQPHDNYTWSQMRTEGLAIEVYDIYTLILKSMVLLDELRHATPLPSTREAFEKECEKHYRFYHIWVSSKDELMDWVSNLKHFLALPVIRTTLSFCDADLELPLSDENRTLMGNVKSHSMYPIMKDFIDMVEEKLITKRRFNLALLEINRYLKSISEGIQFTTSERFLKECFYWGFDRWMESYVNANVPFSQRHGLLDERCRIYFLYIMKMSEKRGREHFGENKWNQMTTSRRTKLVQVCEEGRRAYENTMVDVDTCAYSVMKQTQVPVNSYKVQC